MSNANALNAHRQNDGESVESMLKTRFENSSFPVVEIFQSLKESILNKDPRITHFSDAMILVSIIANFDRVRNDLLAILCKADPSLVAGIKDYVPEVLITVQDGLPDVKAVTGSVNVHVVDLDRNQTMTPEEIDAALAASEYRAPFTGASKVEFQAEIEDLRTYLIKEFGVAPKPVSPASPPGP